MRKKLGGREPVRCCPPWSSPNGQGFFNTSRYSLTVVPPSVTSHKYLVSMGNHDRTRVQLSRRVLRGFDREAFASVRARAGYEIGDLGRLADVGATTIYGWERGTRTPQVDTLARVAEVLGVALDELIRVPPRERTLADLRNLAGLTQPQLGLAAGIRTTALSKVERAEVPLSVERESALAQALGVDVTAIREAYARAKARPAGAPA